MREKCDYTEKITLAMAKAGTTSRKVRVYADGVYDLFNQGHARQLMQAKNLFPNIYLMVGCCNDEIKQQKGRNATITLHSNDMERFESIRHFRFVDEVIRNAPWVITDEFLEYHKIDFVTHNETDETEDTDELYAHVKAREMFVTTQKTEGEDFYLKSKMHKF